MKEWKWGFATLSWVGCLVSHGVIGSEQHMTDDRWCCVGDASFRCWMFMVIS